MFYGGLLLCLHVLLSAACDGRLKVKGRAAIWVGVPVWHEALAPAVKGS